MARVGGVFCPCIETTEKVIGERRLTTLRDLAAQCKGSASEKAAYDAAAQGARRECARRSVRADLSRRRRRRDGRARTPPRESARAHRLPPRQRCARRRRRPWGLGEVVRAARPVTRERSRGAVRRAADGRLGGAAAHGLGPARAAAGTGPAARDSRRRRQPDARARRLLSHFLRPRRDTDRRGARRRAGASRKSGGAPRPWPRSTAPRRRSSRTSATSSARR